MDIQSFWIALLSIATPVAGVVGFAIQLRQVKKTQLENEKLHLEISLLKEKAALSDQSIVVPSSEEVLKVNRGRTMFSRSGHSMELMSSVQTNELQATVNIGVKQSLKETILVSIVVLVFVVIVSYFLYDIYRLSLWVSSKF
ncbi:MAG TPA: hypothetical protein VGK09_09270 [Rhodocyclaceae bacterium]